MGGCQPVCELLRDLREQGELQCAPTHCTVHHTVILEVLLLFMAKTPAELASCVLLLGQAAVTAITLCLLPCIGV